MQVEIEKEGERGRIEYDEKTKGLAVFFNGPYAAIEKHLTTICVFRVPAPGSSKLDNMLIFKARPTASIKHMKLALCTLENETGFRVNWQTFKE